MSVDEADVITQLYKQNATTQARKDGLSEFPSLHLADTANKPLPLLCSNKLKFHVVK
jgi:hypothetical protein